MIRVYHLVILQLAILGAVAQPTANFVLDKVEGCPPLIVNLSNTSSGYVASQWTFGNGNTSIQNSPSATYLHPGTYNIKLVVTNAGGQRDSITKTVHVFIPPTAQFFTPDTSGCRPHTANFFNASIPGEAPITNYAWDFSGPSSQTIPNPTVVFSAANNYQITLVVQDANGCVDNEIKPAYVRVGTSPVAAFTATPTNSCKAPQLVQFTANTSPSIVSYNWNYGDGATGTGATSSHTYGSGSFVARLVTTSNRGCKDSLEQAINIAGLATNFIASDTVICAGETVSFTNLSAPATAWSWSFGEPGGISQQQNPSYTFNNAGTFTVSLHTSGGGCNGMETKTNYITVLPAPPASFSTPDTASCKAPHTANFTATASGATSYHWNFGDNNTSTAQNPSHTYSAVGSYTVKFTAHYASGCSSTVIKNSYVKIVPPQAKFTMVGDSGCIPLTIQFSDSGIISSSAIASLWWDFGNGAGFSATGPTASYTYTAPGWYYPRLAIQTVDGCVDTFTGAPIRAGTKPIVDFTAMPTTPCLGDKVKFTNLSQGGTYYLWDFGDGTSTEFEPNRKFIDTGSHDIKLTVFNNGCSADSTKRNYIFTPVPKADFLVKLDCSNPYRVTFIDTSIKADSWQWLLSDSFATSGVQTWSHTFTSLGSHSARLVVHNDSTGCYDTLTKSFTLGIRNAGFTADTPLVGCAPLLVRFRDTSVGAFNYMWSFGDGAQSNTKSPTYVYNTPGIYNVKLVINTGSQCPDSVTKNGLVIVKGATANFVADTTAGCAPFTVRFTDSSQAFNSNLVSWRWNFGDGTVDSVNQHPTHTYMHWGRYNVTLTVRNDNGCTATKRINRYINLVRPVPNFRVDTIFCPGDFVQFTNTSSADAATYIWNFGDGTTSTEKNPKHAYHSLGRFKVSLQVFNQYGCDSVFVMQKDIHIDTPHVDFTIANTFSPCPPFVATFSNTSSRKDMRWQWDFGDGKTDTIENPTNVYFYPGLYTVRLIGTTNSGCTDTIVYPQLIRVLGPRGNFSITPTSGCAPVTVQITGTITDAVHPWVCDLGNGILYYDSVNFSYRYDSAGVYHPRYILKDTVGCIVSYPLDSIKVGYTPFNKLPNDTAICVGEAVNFSLANGDHFVWTPATAISCDTCASVVMNPTDTITYIVRMSSNNGCFAFDTIIVNVEELPHLQLDSFITLCRNEQLQLHCGNVYRAEWRSGLYLSDSNSISPMVMPLDDITYQVTAYNILNCSVRDTMQLHVIDKVQIAAMPDTSICKGELAQLRLNVLSSSISGVQVQWVPAAGLTSDTILNPIAISGNSAFYQVIVTSSLCQPDTEDIRITAYEKPDIKAGDDARVTKGSLVELYVSSKVKDVTYQWRFTGNDEPTCLTCRVPKVNATTSQLAIATVTNSIGCQNTDTVHITVYGCDQDAVYVPNLFSPNDDQENDVFRVRSILLDKFDYMRIFDRWGQIVFESDNINHGWDGRIRGMDAPGGVYVYVLEAQCSNGERVKKNGSVTLVR